MLSKEFIKTIRKYKNGLFRVSITRSNPSKKTPHKKWSDFTSEKKFHHNACKRYHGQFNQFMSIKWQYYVTITFGTVKVTKEYEKKLRKIVGKKRAQRILSCKDSDGKIDFNNNYKAASELLKGFVNYHTKICGDCALYPDAHVFDSPDHIHSSDDNYAIAALIKHIHYHGASTFLFDLELWHYLSGASIENGIYQSRWNYGCRFGFYNAKDAYNDIKAWFNYSCKRSNEIANAVNERSVHIVTHNELLNQKDSTPETTRKSVSEEEYYSSPRNTFDSRLRRRKRHSYQLVTHNENATPQHCEPSSEHEFGSDNLHIAYNTIPSIVFRPDISKLPPANPQIDPPSPKESSTQDVFTLSSENALVNCAFKRNAYRITSYTDLVAPSLAEIILLTRPPDIALYF